MQVQQQQKRYLLHENCEVLELCITRKQVLRLFHRSISMVACVVSKDDLYNIRVNEGSGHGCESVSLKEMNEVVVQSYFYLLMDNWSDDWREFNNRLRHED